MKFRKLFAAAAVFCTLAILLAGCGAKTDKASIATADDIAGLNIAVQSGTIGDDLAQEIKAGDDTTIVTGYTKYIDAITALKQMKSDAVIMDNAPAEYFVEQNTDLMVLAEELTTEEYAIAIRKDNTELLTSVNSALAEMKTSGELAAIILKYQKDMSSVTSVDLNEGATGGTLTMGTETGFAPYEYKEGEAILGIDVEIAAAIAKKLNMKLVITDMDFDGLISALTTSKIDIIAAGMTVTDERKESVNFSDAYIDAKQVVVIRKSSFKG
ncbi:MAG: transporter substrate-binding domain-containing protein [Saccharofermentanales bacterium]